MNTSLPLRTDIPSLLRIAIPISLGSLVQFVVVLTDNFFLSRAGETAINGAGNAALVYLTLIMAITGGSVGIQILVARFQGTHHHSKKSEAARTGRWALLTLGAVLVSLSWVVGAVGGWDPLIHNPDVRNIFTSFLGIRMWGLLPYALLMAIEGDWIGQAKSWPILLVSVVMAGFNVLLDGMWVEGLWGGTALGADGAAYASLTSECAGALLAWVLTRWKIHPESFQKGAPLSREMIRQWWSMSAPVMGQFVLTIATWASFFFLVERVGMLELKVSHITRNAFMLASVVCMGLAQTTRTVVSTLLGEGRSHDILPTMGKLILMSYVGVWGLTHGYLLYPQWLAGFFFDTPEGLGAMKATLHTAFVALQMFALSGIIIAVLQGAGFTRAVFAIELTTVTLYITVAYMLTMVWPQTIDVIWRADWAYFGGMITGGLIGLWRLNWREGHPSLSENT
ncbi:MAG: MATE family efflux transporter [Bacteroidetes bacterium]|nr:MATE family efflux transporter [Bacteroidota bacterium]MDA0902787.1 MATE family efflux transporter [Bacteroidota bacterium]MDA1243065.1 MATE family efflux transporter [Bacteroidota bacterium]